MPKIVTDDGVNLYYEECGTGTPIVFLHEFGGNYRSWEPQMRYFARRHRCVAYAARGFPPSDVPTDPEAYSEDRAADDIVAVLRALNIDQAHLVGLSMGSTAALNLARRHDGVTLSITAAGVGSGASPDLKAKFHAETEAMAEALRQDGMQAAAERYANGPTRAQLRYKDPRGWQEFYEQLVEHSAEGSALTMLGVQRRRDSLYDLAEPLSRLRVPILVIAGDEDEPTLDVSLFLKRTIPSCGLAMFPRTGHTINLEEPDLFNRTVEDFIATVEAGRWNPRDTEAARASVMFGR